MVRVLNRGHLHFADADADPAMGAFALIHPIPEPNGFAQSFLAQGLGEIILIIVHAPSILLS